MVQNCWAVTGTETGKFTMPGPRICLETILVKPSFAQQSPNQNEWEIKRGFHQENETEWVGDSDSRRLRERQTERAGDWESGSSQAFGVPCYLKSSRTVTVPKRTVIVPEHLESPATWNCARERGISCSLFHLLSTFSFSHSFNLSTFLFLWRKKPCLTH